MNDSSTVHQVKYILSIQSKRQPLSSPVFRGTLEVISGQKFEFTTLDGLNSLLCEIGGWIDPLPCADEGGKAKISDTESNESNYSP